MTSNPVNQLDCPIGKIDPYSFEDMVNKLPDEQRLVSDYIWDKAWTEKDYLRTVMKKWFNQGGGTIHQVIERVMEAKHNRAINSTNEERA